MNKGIVAMGVVIFLFSFYPILYPVSTTIGNAYPFFYYGLIVMLIGLVTMAIGAEMDEVQSSGPYKEYD